MSVCAFREVFEKGLEEDRFAQNNLGCPLTIFYRYPLCLILSIVDKQFHLCASALGEFTAD